MKREKESVREPVQSTSELDDLRVSNKEPCVNQLNGFRDILGVRKQADNEVFVCKQQQLGPKDSTRAAHL